MCHDSSWGNLALKQLNPGEDLGAHYLTVFPVLKLYKSWIPIYLLNTTILFPLNLSKYMCISVASSLLLEP